MSGGNLSMRLVVDVVTTRRTTYDFPTLIGTGDAVEMIESGNWQPAAYEDSHQSLEIVSVEYGRDQRN